MIVLVENADGHTERHENVTEVVQTEANIYLKRADLSDTVLKLHTWKIYQVCQPVAS